MDNKAPPPQYGSPAPGQYGSPAPGQYGSPAPGQYGSPAPGQYAQPQPQGYVVQQHVPQYGQGVPQQHQQPVQYQQQAPMQAAPRPATEEWQNSLMDCGPCDTCCLGTWCPCILLGQTSNRIRDPTMATNDSCNSDCMILCAINYFTGCGWIYVMIKRSEIRERYGIKGDGMADCCTTFWCSCCALIQQEKEVIARTQPQQHHVAQGYQVQGVMEMPPPAKTA